MSHLHIFDTSFPHEKCELQIQTCLPNTWKILCVYPFLSSFYQAVLIHSHSLLSGSAALPVCHMYVQKGGNPRQIYKRENRKKDRASMTKIKMSHLFSLPLLVTAALWFFSDMTTCWVLITGLIMLKNPNRGGIKNGILPLILPPCQWQHT